MATWSRSSPGTTTSGATPTAAWSWLKRCSCGRPLDDLDVEGKRVLVRVDFNVPLDEDRNITDDARIRAALPTLTELRSKGAATLVLLAHRGRPKGRDETFSLRPAADRLSQLLDTPVALAPDLESLPAPAVKPLRGLPCRHDGDVVM